MKRLLAILLSLMMILGMFPGTALAEGGGELALVPDKDTAAPGETVEVYVKLNRNPGIAYLEFVLSYDQSRLGEPSFTGILSGWTVGQKFVWSGSSADEDDTTTGDVLKLSFPVKADAPEGAAEISLTNFVAFNLNEEDVVFEIVNTSVSIGAGETPHEHADEDGDLFCDECGERMGINVTVTSASTAGGGTVATVSGGGKLYYGESTELNAPAVDGYSFDGWYRDGALYSANAQCGFTATEEETEDVAFVAQYTPEAGAQRRLTVTGSQFTISGIASEQSEHFTDLFDLDSEVTVTYTGSEEFLYWVNGSNKIMGTSKEQTLHMVADTEMRAICANAENQANGAFVVYVTSPSNGQVVASRYYSDTEEIAEPQAYERVGYTFERWALSVDEIREKMATENKIIVYPIYAASGETYTVTVENNAGAEAFVSEAIEAGQEYVAHADPALGEFSYWKLNGKIVSYNEELVIRGIEDVTVTAVYGEEVRPEPVMTLTYVSQMQKEGKTTITFSSLRAVTEEYTVERVGILYSTRTDLEGKSQEELQELMVLGADGVNQRLTESKVRNAVYNLNLSASRPVHVYGRAFMILMKDGVSYTFYSDEILDLSNGQ